MKYFVFVLQLLPFILFAQPNHLVISQVYGGGGNSGAVYTHDFIELFNPTLQPIDLNGFSLQYTSATGSSWTSIISLTGSIASRKYFLVQLAGGTNGNSLPVADQTGNINLSATSGKIGLVNGILALVGSCPQAVSLIDFLGYGTSNCSEGLAAPGGSNTLAILRKSGGCLDSDNNAVDFIASSPVPKNSFSAPMDCSGQNSNLPIFFTNENIQFKDGKIHISWQNALEMEVSNYMIQGSLNGIDYSTVSIVLPNKNDGSFAHYLEKVDQKDGVNCYRIAGMELNGNTTYSKVLFARSKNFEGIAIFPNPVIDDLNLKIAGIQKGICRISIYNNLGILIKEITLLKLEGLMEYKIDVDNISSGLYYLAVNGKMAGKFIKASR
jgi:hypothetical protein